MVALVCAVEMPFGEVFGDGEGDGEGETAGDGEGTAAGEGIVDGSTMFDVCVVAEVVGGCLLRP